MLLALTVKIYKVIVEESYKLYVKMYIILITIKFLHYYFIYLNGQC